MKERLCQGSGVGVRGSGEVGDDKGASRCRSLAERNELSPSLPPLVVKVV